MVIYCLSIQKSNVGNVGNGSNKSNGMGESAGGKGNFEF